MNTIKHNIVSRVRGERVALVLVLAVMVLWGSGCDEEEVKYLLQQAPGQLALLLDRVPFEKVLKDPDLDPVVRSKLELVLDVKRYGVEEVGLRRNKNYEIFVELDREAVSWNLTAAERLSLTPLTWTFPLVGEVPYLGFFQEEDAREKERQLKEQGYDVYVRTAGAYSMLGIVADPLYSPLLKYRDAELANLVLHEMTHATVFIKGEMEFNENLALFGGNQGSFNYLADRFGPASEEAKYALGSNQDDVIFSREVMKLYQDLEAMYQSDLPPEDKARGKEAIIAEHKRHFREEVLPAMHTDNYARWPEREINNATVISRVVYFHDLGLYERLYQAKSEDLKAVVDFFKEVAALKGVRPEDYARKWLEEHAQQ
jgi:predicted aminopeptidase